MRSTRNKADDFIANNIETSSSSSTHASPPAEAFRYHIDDNTSLAMSHGLPTSSGLGPISTFQGPAFTFFTKLPHELQNMVWTLAAFEPRVVEIHSYKHINQWENRRRKKPKKEIRFLTRTLVPAILHTCLRSRGVGLIFYDRLCFGNHFSGCYINWTCDYVKFETALKSVLESSGETLFELTRKCQRLIIRDSEYLFLFLQQQGFRNLKEAVLLCRIKERQKHLTTNNLGSLTLVSIDDPRFLAASKSVLTSHRRREDQLNILTQVEDLDLFGAVILAGQQPGTETYFDGQELFQPDEVRSVVWPFQQLRLRGKRTIVRGAIRGEEQGMTREQKTARKKREKEAAQKEFRLANPEVPWHEHGFENDCSCVECAGSGST